MKNLTEMTKQYLETALWSSGDEFDSKSLLDIDQEVIEQAEKDLDLFIQKIADSGLDVSDLDVTDLAHDFWLTRNNHGAGFWDGDYEEILGKELTAIAESFGQIDLYVGDDGKVYAL